ncbi:T9SS type A sorting domain-containing protein [Labilibacter sediminis]|nr:T9SS type A sorting domain-containing protein [Labilibacter sediminis]
MRIFVNLTVLLLLFTSSLYATDYYVSNDGNDSNNGTIDSPWLSLAKVSAAAASNKNGGFLQPGDRILFKSGDTFEGQLVMYRKGTESQPIVLTSYGSGVKPIISGSGNIPTGDYIEVVKLINCAYITLEGLWIKNDRKNIGDITWGTNNSVGIYVKANKWGGVCRGFVFRNLDITDVFGYDMIDWEGKFTRDYYTAHGIYFDSEANDLSVNPIIEIGIEDVLVEDCYFYNLGSRGISARHLSNVTNNLIDDEDRNKNFIVRNNIFRQLGGDGVVFASQYNALVENNEFIDLGWGDHTSSTDRYFGRGEGCWVWNARNLVVQYNKQYRARGYGDTYGAGGHIDFFCKNVVFQYNYSEDTEGGFCEVLGDCRNSIYRYNVSVNDGHRANGHHRYSIWLSGYVGSDQTPVPSHDTYIYNNTIYLDADKCKPDIFIFAGDTYIYNNIFYAINGAQIGAGGVEIDMQNDGELLVSNNLFYGDIASDFTQLDANKVLGSDPLFINATGTDRVTEDFNIQSESTSIDAGKTFAEPEFPLAGQGIFKDIATISDQDAFGNHVDLLNHTPNIGASNAHNSDIQLGVKSAKQVNNLFQICQNPVKQQLNIKLNKQLESPEIKVYAINGQLIKDMKMGADLSNMQVSLPSYAGNGIYYLMLKSENIYQVQKFVLYR